MAFCSFKVVAVSDGKYKQVCAHCGRSVVTGVPILDLKAVCKVNKHDPTTECKLSHTHADERFDYYKCHICNQEFKVRHGVIPLTRCSRGNGRSVAFEKVRVEDCCPGNETPKIKRLTGTLNVMAQVRNHSPVPAMIIGLATRKKYGEYKDGDTFVCRSEDVEKDDRLFDLYKYQRYFE